MAALERARAAAMSLLAVEGFTGPRAGGERCAQAVAASSSTRMASEVRGAAVVTAEEYAVRSDRQQCAGIRARVRVTESKR